MPFRRADIEWFSTKEDIAIFLTRGWQQNDATLDGLSDQGYYQVVLYYLTFTRCLRNCCHHVNGRDEGVPKSISLIGCLGTYLHLIGLMLHDVVVPGPCRYALIS